MKMSIKRIGIFVLTAALLYQDTLTRLTGLSFLNYLDEVIILMLFGTGLLRSRGKIPRFVVRLLLLTALFFGIGIVCCLVFSEYRPRDLMMAALLSIKFFLVVAAVLLHKPSVSCIRMLQDAVKALGAFGFVCGVVNFVMPALWTSLFSFTWIETRAGIHNVMGLFIHPGQFGWFMLFAGILYYSQYKTGRRRRDLAFAAAYAAMAMLSLKAKVILGVGCVVLADWFLVDHKKIYLTKYFGPVAGIAAMLGVFGSIIYENIGLYILGTVGEETARHALLDRSFRIAADYFPAGVGFGKFGSWYARIRYSEYYYQYNCTTIYGLRPEDPRFATDTFWPAVLGETGVLGLLVYLILLGMMGVRLLKTARANWAGAFAKSTALFGFLTLVQSLAESMGEAAFNSSPQNIFLGVAVGLGLCMGVMRRRYSEVDGEA